jgi:hypothetical protein
VLPTLRAVLVLLAFAAPAAASTASDENALPGDALPSQRAPDNAIEGYPSTVSVAPGDRLELHVATDPIERYRVDIYRLGWYGGTGSRRIACSPSCAGEETGHTRPPDPEPDPETGLVRPDWPVTDVLAVDPSWTSGFYAAVFVLTGGPNAGAIGQPAPFVVRASTASAPTAVVVNMPSNTWAAYDAWGGRSLYTTPRATAVTFQRPQVSRGVNLWEHRWELPLVRFLEREGYDVSYVADSDVDGDPDALDRHRLAITAGHGEYWTGAMRDRYDGALSNGTNLLFAGANTAYWQVRYASEGRTMISYKLDPDPIGDPALATTQFRSLTPARPECRLLGVQYEAGTWLASPDRRDYTVTGDGATDPYLAGSGLAEGAALVGLVGPEFDGRTNPACQPATGARVLLDYGNGAASAVRYTAPSGARVFSAGSLQWSWGLDALRLDRAFTDVPVSTGLQQVARNLLADMQLPETPRPLASTVDGGGYDVTNGLPADPRITEISFFRHPGQADFDIPAADRVAACAGAPTCHDSAGADRDYRYAVVVRDRWGGSATGFSPQDTIAPAARIIAAPAAATRRRKAAFRIDPGEPRAALECSRDGGPWQRCEHSLSWSRLSDGGHYLRARATDVAGNRGPEVVVRFAVDTVAPHITIAAPRLGAKLRAGERLPLRFRCTDPPPGVGVARCSGPKRAARSSAGVHRVTVVALDRVGNRKVVRRAYRVLPRRLASGDTH